MSILLSVLLISGHASTSLPSIDPTINLLNLLKTVAIIFYPITGSKITDGTHSQRRDLLTLKKTYLSEADQCVQRWPVSSEVLDKPNCHRLIINMGQCHPFFGYGLSLSDHGLKMVHRALNTWLDNMTYHNSHISEMEHALSRYWTLIGR